MFLYLNPGEFPFRVKEPYWEMTYRRESHTGGGGGIGQPARPSGFQLASRHELVYESMAISTKLLQEPLIAARPGLGGRY